MKNRPEIDLAKELAVYQLWREGKMPPSFLSLTAGGLLGLY